MESSAAKGAARCAAQNVSSPPVQAIPRQDAVGVSRVMNGCIPNELQLRSVMMKQLIQRMFFGAEPEKGAFFAWTLLFTLPWFALAWFFHNALAALLSSRGAAAFFSRLDILTPLLVALLLLFYASYLAQRFARQVRRNPARRKARYLSAISSILAVFAVFTLWAIADSAFADLDTILAQTNIRGFDYNKYIGFTASGWCCLALISILLVVAAYVLIGKSIAWLGEVPYRKLITKPVLALWILTAVSYLACLLMALQATTKYHQAIADVADYFGRPLTPSALAELYHQGRAPDAEFWNTLKALAPAFAAETAGMRSPDGVKYHSGASIVQYPQAVFPDDIYDHWQALFRGDDNLKKRSAMHESPLPPTERPYADNQPLFGMPLPELSQCRNLMLYERWGLRFASEDGDAQTVKRTLARMENLCRYLQHDPLLISSLVWMGLEDIRLQAIVSVAAKPWLDDDWLREQIQKLDDLENTVPATQQKAIYGEAVFAVNATNWLTRFLPLPGSEYSQPTQKYYTLRWFFPQAWSYLARTAEETIRAYAIADFAEFPGPATANPFLALTAPALHKAGKQNFPTLVAKLRITRALLAAERSKRRDGRYPEQPDDLPLDPFSGTPLKYRLGPCEVPIVTCSLISREDGPMTTTSPAGDASPNSPPEYDFIRENHRLEAVQVWSVGPNGRDDDGMISWPKYDPKRNKDDIRYIIRLE